MEKKFNGFDPDRMTNKEIERYFEMIKKDGVKLSELEKKRIKKQIFKHGTRK